MKNQAITERIQEVFRNNANQALSYNELIHALGVVKRGKALVSETLQALVSEGVISKKSRKFRLNHPVTAQTASGDTAKSMNPKLIEGIFDATPLARNFSYAFVRTEQGDFYVNSEDTLNAYHNDVVVIEPHYKKGRSDFALIRKILKRSNEFLPGDIEQSQNRTLFISSNPKIHNWFEVSDAGQARVGDKVILQVTNWGNPLLGKVPVGKVTEVLGPSGDPQVELLAVLRQYRLSLEFPTAVIEEAASLNDTITDEELAKRKDFRELFTFTIDPASAKDFDDAISLEKTNQGWRLYVHIADVAHYVTLGSELFQEASQRGNSFYFPKKVIPMLPERLSNQICSLRPEEEKLTLSVVTDFDLKGRISRQKLYESVIRSDFRLSYEEVDALFEGADSDLPTQLVEVLSEARILSNLLSQKRLAAGYIFFDLPEIEYEYDEEGFVRRLNLAEETESHKLIENFMLVANEFVASKLTELSPTTLYRIHENPDLEKLDRLAELLSYYGINLDICEDLNRSLQYLLNSLPSLEHHKVFDRIILRSMKKAKYSTLHIRHFGLGMETYTHFTSPIRRLCDLVVHHLCKIYVLHSSRAKLGAQQIKHFASVASEQELQADQAERDIERVYSLAYMKSHVGESFSGIVISTNSTSLIVRLNEIPINAVLKIAQLPTRGWEYRDREMRHVNSRTNEYYQLMDKVLVQIMDVSDDIYLQLEQKPDAHTHIRQMPPGIANLKHQNKMQASGRHRGRNAIDAKATSKKSGLSAKKQKRKR